MIKMLKNTVKRTLTDYLYITFGTLLLTAGVYFFKIPNGFVTGGVSGIGTVLGNTFPVLSASAWIAVINMLLLLVGFIFIGKDTGIKTVYCSTLFSLFTYLLGILCPISSSLTDQPLLELVYAMFLTSIGAAIIFNCSASSGGTDIVALILKKYTSINVGQSLLYVDFFVAVSSFWVFGIKAGLFSLLGLFAKAFLVDGVLESINSCKYFVVITDKSEEVMDYIMHTLHRGVTAHEVLGVFSGTEKTMIHSVCRRIEAVRLRRQIAQIDPQAFVIITTTSEIVGRGFRAI